MESNLRYFVEDRSRRIEKVNNRIKRGKAVKPGGQFFVNSVSLDKIREQAVKTSEAEAKKAEKRQLRESQRVLKLKIESLRQQWRGDKVHEIDGRMKTLTFKQWLELTRLADNYISLEVCNKEYRRLLNIHDERFFFDIERRGRRPGLDDAIAAASRAAKPLTAFEHPPSDASVEIFTQRPPAQSEQSDDDDFSSLHDPNEHHDAIQTQAAPNWAPRSTPPPALAMPSSPVLPSSPPVATPCPQARQRPNPALNSSPSTARQLA
ncbi:hypothetical protein HIM_11149 [Hirsutella minnesotensis 3608]|uniref:Uncharacterized protein n=1 Tax=Hirsutella minnesotensis 3608 TaxID=1043627 RepID=A0A0F7ZFN8_9HYPO|nr:hypothetical protein HIM_11149 [Hirsutella minnesotensis 3608]